MVVRSPGGRASASTEFARKRNDLLAHVSDDPERSATGAVLAATNDATYDDRTLSNDERGHVAALLALPLPERTDRIVQIKRNAFSILPAGPTLSGKADAVLRAIQILDELPQDIATPAEIGAGAAWWCRDVNAARGMRCSPTMSPSPRTTSSLLCSASQQSR